MTLDEKPHIAAFLKFPAGVTAVARFDRDIALIMGSTLWFYAPFSSRRQASAGLIHHKYDHSQQIVAVCVVQLPGSYSASVIPGAFDPGAADGLEANLLMLDSTASFLIINLGRSFVCADFAAPEITCERIQAIRGSLVRPGEFAALTDTAVLICQLNLDLRTQPPGARILATHAVIGNFIREFATGYLALRDTDLLFIDRESCDEYCPGVRISRVAVDDTAIITVGPESENQGSVIGVNGRSFRVQNLMAFDAHDGYLAILLKSWVLLVIDGNNFSHRMHVQVGASKTPAFDKRTTMLCGVTSDHTALLVYFFCADMAMAVDVPLGLFPSGDAVDDTGE
jgi:hypothetical protein